MALSISIAALLYNRVCMKNAHAHNIIIAAAVADLAMVPWVLWNLWPGACTKKY